MGEQRDIWKTMGYAALLAGIIIGIVNIGLTFSKSTEMKESVLEYGLYGISASLPMVMVSEKLKAFFSPRISRKKRTKPDERAEELEFGEFLLIDEKPSVAYFLAPLLSLLLSGSLVVYLVFLRADIFNVNMLVASFVLMTLSYSLSKRTFRQNTYLSKAGKFWSLFFALWWGMSLINILKVQVESAYHIQFWEKLLGIPPVSMILFAFILFLFSSIFWHVDSYFSVKARGPMSAVSIVFMVAGVAAIFPPLWVAFSENNIYIFVNMFIAVHCVFTALLLAFTVRRGGMRFMFTNRRIIVSKDFLVRDVKEYLYDSVLSVEVIQGFLGKHLDYGDLRFSIKRNGGKLNFTVYGVKNPGLVKNTVLAMASKENTVLDEYGKKPWTSGIAHIKYYGPETKKSYHLKPY